MLIGNIRKYLWVGMIVRLRLLILFKVRKGLLVLAMSKIRRIKFMLPIFNSLERFICVIGVMAPYISFMIDLIFLS